MKYVHIISGARNVELYVKQTNLAQTNYVTTIRGNRLDPENNDINRVFVSDFLNKTNPRIKYDVVKLKLLSLVDKTKCIVNGIFIGVYENPSINSPLIGTNPSETQRTSFIQQQQQSQPQQSQPPAQNYNLINTYQMQFMLSSEVKKMEARLITRLDRTCLLIVENFNKKISSIEERLGLMEDTIEEIVNRIIPENDETSDVKPQEQSEQQQQQLPQENDEEKEEEEEPLPQEEKQEEEELHQQNIAQNAESNNENVVNNSLEESESQNEQQINCDYNNTVEHITTESERDGEIKRIEESEDHTQQTTETECSECD